MPQRAEDSVQTMMIPWRVVVAIVAANSVCLACIVVGVWVVLHWTGADETLTTIAAAGFGSEHVRPSVVFDPWATLDRLYIPIMAGVQGLASIASGSTVGLIAGRRFAAGAVIGIVPLYVNTFSKGPAMESIAWACAYVAAAVLPAYLIGRERRQVFRA
ncbi:MAG TPA: hypothetical protein VL225_09635 [Vicinamibacterales bacterium]|nr:hypothetical protein [Vicinamibacterales bacterium]